MSRSRIETEFASVRQAAEETRLTQARIRDLIRQGRVRVTRVGGYHILIPRSELRKLAADANVNKA